MNSSQSDDSHTHALGTDLAVKPLPQLPRGWSRVCHETGLFLRSVGLGILVTTFQGFFTNNFLEPEKAAIRRSRVTAFLRALIHIPPLGLSIFEIIFNCKGHYLGAVFNGQNYLQFVAKAHEICIQASLATIALSYIRYQICTGRGIPFGAMLGALQFFQISYLWSVEFWSSIFSKDFQLREKLCFAVLILVCVIITATAGPSSANLLIAQHGSWPTGSFHFSVTATLQDIWPNRLDDKRVSANCSTISLPSYDDCPISTLYPFITEDLEKQSLGTFLSLADKDIEIKANHSDISRKLLVIPCFDGYTEQVCSTLPMDDFAEVLSSFPNNLYYSREGGNAFVMREDGSLMEEDGSSMSYYVLKKAYYQPYTTGICLANPVQNSSDQAALQFPLLSKTAAENTRDTKAFLVPDLKKGSSIDNIPGNTHQIRVGWVDLPYKIFGTGVPGAIIIHPQSMEDPSYRITTCTLNAGWGSSSITIDTDEKQRVGSYMTEIPSSWHIPSEGYLDGGYKQIPAMGPMFQNTSQFSYPQLHINISKTWMEFLNPSIVQFDNSTTNFISMITPLMGGVTKDDFAFILNFLLVAALSRARRDRYMGTYDDPYCLSPGACSPFEVEVSSYGWGYNAQHTTTRLAIAVMLAYCVLVFGHLIYSGISGVSSTAWDSVAEMMVLAMNSSPTKTLQNTCAGIIGRSPFQTNVRVMKTSEKHLELVFGEIKDPNANFSYLTMNEKYGSIADVREDEDELLDMEVQGELLLGSDLV